MDSAFQLLSISLILSSFAVRLVGINSKGKTLSSISSNGLTIILNGGVNED
jgi:hypothetical protein